MRDEQEELGIESVTLQVECLNETWTLIQDLASEQGWPLDEALLTLIGYGIGYAQGERFVHADSDERQRFVERLNLLESQHAVMKFRAYTLQRDNKRLELRESGAQHVAAMADAVLIPLQQERKQWRTEKVMLQAEIERLRGKIDEGSRPKKGLASLWTRLFPDNKRDISSQSNTSDKVGGVGR